MLLPGWHPCHRLGKRPSLCALGAPEPDSLLTIGDGQTERLPAGFTQFAPQHVCTLDRGPQVRTSATNDTPTVVRVERYLRPRAIVGLDGRRDRPHALLVESHPGVDAWR